MTDPTFTTWPPEPRGGQHTTSTRLGVIAFDEERHIGVVCETERSQYANKVRAVEMLREMTAPRLALTKEDRDALRCLGALVRQWAPVIEAARVMRNVHEGCCTTPACGNCDRCVFDRAVDVLDGCEVLPFSSRTCKHGTRGCVAQHVDALDKERG